jgi:uncharacterized membrane protein YgcG
MVMTPTGATSIETLQVGDEVLSFTDTGRVSVSKVEKLHTHPADDILLMKYWGGSLRITANHWVLNQYNTFAAAGTLSEHDAMVDCLGHLRPILGVCADGVEPVYNLTVLPFHTFIADGIRVHNGGRGHKRPVVGSGGGDSKGGGGSRAAVEDPDTLQSHQYAKIIDLLSEGPIGGLVNGLQSVYLNETPVMGLDGVTANFSGITADTRNGTNDQTAMKGFNDVENEYAVNVEIVKATPIVRSLSGAIDAARITLGFPTLTLQDTTTGDLHGTSVDIKIEVQNNGGGYKPAAIAYQWDATAANGLQVDVPDGYGVGMTFSVDLPVAVYSGSYNGDGGDGGDGGGDGDGGDGGDGGGDGGG